MIKAHQASTFYQQLFFFTNMLMQDTFVRSLFNIYLIEVLVSCVCNNLKIDDYNKYLITKLSILV